MVFLEINQVTVFFSCNSNFRSKSYLAMVFTRGEYTFAVKCNNVVQSDFWHQSPPNGSPMISSCHEDHH